jgi:hypothetical protein
MFWVRGRVSEVQRLVLRWQCGDPSTYVGPHLPHVRTDHLCGTCGTECARGKLTLEVRASESIVVLGFTALVG